MRQIKNNFDKKYYASGSYKNYDKEAVLWFPFFGRKIHSILGPAPKKVFEIGCAFGDLIAELQDKYGYDVEGVDFSEYAIAHAQKSVKRNIRQGDVLNLNFKKNCFDAIIFLDVINHLTKDESAEAIKRAVDASRHYIFFSGIYSRSWATSQVYNPDKFRLTTLSKKEYIEFFENCGAKLIGHFLGNGGDVLIFKKSS